MSEVTMVRLEREQRFQGNSQFYGDLRRWHGSIQVKRRGTIVHNLIVFAYAHLSVQMYVCV